MSGLIALIALTAVAALLPVGMHFGGLRGAPLQPEAGTQSSKAERLIFKLLPLLFVLNGGLVGAAVFLTKSGSAVAAIIFGVLSIPSLTAQLAALMIAKARDVAGAGRRSANVL